MRDFVSKKFKDEIIKNYEQMIMINVSCLEFSSIKHEFGNENFVNDLKKKR